MLPVINESMTTLSKKLADVVVKLKPFQSLEYDPETGFAAIVTELLISGEDIDQISEILANCAEEEKVTVKRYADNYKITLIRRVML